MDQMDIAEELGKIRSRGSEVSSTTLLKTDTLRVVLTALKAGARLHKHHADGRLVVQVLEGEIEFHAEDTPHHLHKGTLVSLEAMAQHEVTASTDAVLLLTIAWSASGKTGVGGHRSEGYV
jgi:quercetin dioxygenase-like cupin family protein